MSRRIRVILVDDSAMLLRSMKRLLSQESDIEVIGTYADGESALEAALVARPKVALLDYQLPGENGAELCHKLRQRLPDMMCIILTGRHSVEIPTLSLAAGANGLLTKSVEAREIAPAIRRAAAGDIIIDQLSAQRLREHIRACARPPDTKLTEKETAIRALRGQGKSYKEIGVLLQMGTETVHTHLQRAKRKVRHSQSVELTRAIDRLGELGQATLGGEPARRKL